MVFTIWAYLARHTVEQIVNLLFSYEFSKYNSPVGKKKKKTHMGHDSKYYNILPPYFFFFLVYVHFGGVLDAQ